MRKRQLVTKPILRQAMETAGKNHASLVEDDSRILLDAAAPLIAAKALNDFADFFKETGLGIGMDPKVAAAVENIARRYARDWIA